MNTTNNISNAADRAGRIRLSLSSALQSAGVNCSVYSGDLYFLRCPESLAILAEPPFDLLRVEQYPGGTACLRWELPCVNGVSIEEKPMNNSPSSVPKSAWQPCKRPSNHPRGRK